MGKKEEDGKQEAQVSAEKRLQKILGFDPTKNGSGKGVLTEALSVIQNERAEQNKKKAEELIRKAISSAEKMAEAKKKFEGEMNKSEKELSKLVSAIEALGGK